MLFLLQYIMTYSNYSTCLDQTNSFNACLTFAHTSCFWCVMIHCLLNVLVHVCRVWIMVALPFVLTHHLLLVDVHWCTVICWTCIEFQTSSQSLCLCCCGLVGWNEQTCMWSTCAIHHQLDMWSNASFCQCAIVRHAICCVFVSSFLFVWSVFLFTFQCMVFGMLFFCWCILTSILFLLHYVMACANLSACLDTILSMPLSPLFTHDVFDVSWFIVC